MALKELQIRGLRPADKIYQCTDERGLYLEVHPNERYKYRHMGKQKRLALGRYPDVGLAEARRRRDDARRKLEAGNDRPGRLSQPAKGSAIVIARPSSHSAPARRPRTSRFRS